MQMAFRNKEDTIKEAERLGIDVTGMDWPAMQKAVADGLKKEEMGLIRKDDRPPEEKELDKYIGTTIPIAPELKPDANRIIRYDEQLGDDVDIEEKSFTAGGSNSYTAGRDYATGTYRIKGRTGRKVVAESSLPKENAQIVFRPGIDDFPVVTFQGRSGYLYKHTRFPNFRDVLIASGYYDDYKDQLRDEPNVFYLTGLLCVNPHLARHIMDEIETREKHRRRDGGDRWHR